MNGNSHSTGRSLRLWVPSDMSPTKYFSYVPVPNTLQPLPPLARALETGDIPQIPEASRHDARSAIPFKGGETAALCRLEDYFWNLSLPRSYKVCFGSSVVDKVGFVLESGRDQNLPGCRTHVMKCLVQISAQNSRCGLLLVP